MSYLSGRIQASESNQVIRFNTTTGTFECVSGSQYKAFASISWKANTLASDAPLDTWVKIHTNVSPIAAVDSGNTVIGPFPGETTTFQYQYVDPVNNSPRIFRCGISFLLDCSIGDSTKILEFRLVFNGFALTPFTILDSHRSGQQLFAEVLLPLSPNDIIYIEFRNTVDSNPVLFKYADIVVTEI